MRHPTIKKRAELHLRYGAMNRGKSTVLLQAECHYEEQGRQERFAKLALDTKGADQIASWLGLTCTVDFTVEASLDI